MPRCRDVEVTFSGLEGRGINYNALRMINGKGLSTRYYFTEEGILITFRHHNQKICTNIDYDYGWNGVFERYYNYKALILIEKDDDENTVRNIIEKSLV
jgi:hypothetical protein